MYTSTTETIIGEPESPSKKNSSEIGSKFITKETKTSAGTQEGTTNELMNIKEHMESNTNIVSQNDGVNKEKGVESDTFSMKSVQTRTDISA